MLAILRALPLPTTIARIVAQEQPLRILRENPKGGGLAVETIDLQPLLKAGVLVMASLTTEAEEEQMVDLATLLEEDEATTAVLARLRGKTIGVDDPVTTALLRQYLPDIQVVSTPILLQQWVEHSRPPTRALRATLQNIHQGTGYVPSVDHPLYLWWQEVLKTTKNDSV